MVSATYMERFIVLYHMILLLHTYNFFKKKIFVFVMLCMMCSLCSWNPNGQIQKGIILCFGYLKYIYAVRKELSKSATYLISSSQILDVSNFNELRFFNDRLKITNLCFRSLEGKNPKLSRYFFGKRKLQV
jgi:hypothetical protein